MNLIKSTVTLLVVTRWQMQIVQKLNKRRKQIFIHHIWLMSLSHSMLFMLSRRPSFFFAHVHTQKHLHKRKSHCFNFHPGLLLSPQPIPLPCQVDLHAPFFSWTLLCRNCPCVKTRLLPGLPSLHHGPAQTQLTGDTGTAMTRSRAVPQIPLNPESWRPWMGRRRMGLRVPFSPSSALGVCSALY